MVNDSNGIRTDNLLIRKRTLNHLGMTLLNAISLHMFQNKINISPPVLPASLAEHLQILKKMCFICIKGALSGLRQFLAAESPLQMMKNTFYLTLKALFVLKIFKFLS